MGRNHVGHIKVETTFHRLVSVPSSYSVITGLAIASHRFRLAARCVPNEICCIPCNVLERKAGEGSRRCDWDKFGCHRSTRIGRPEKESLCFVRYSDTSVGLVTLEKNNYLIIDHLRSSCQSRTPPTRAFRICCAGVVQGGESCCESVSRLKKET